LPFSTADHAKRAKTQTFSVNETGSKSLKQNNKDRQKRTAEKTQKQQKESQEEERIQRKQKRFRGRTAIHRRYKRDAKKCSHGIQSKHDESHAGGKKAEKYYD
jgi:hypothetical protein